MKKKIWITSLLAALSITAVGGFSAAKINAVKTNAAEVWTVGEMDNKYLYGTSLDVPEATVEVNGAAVAATPTVTYPNGLTTTADNVKLTQAGIYTITYRAVVNGTQCVEKKTFEVEDKAYLVQSDKSSVTYGTYTNYGANSTGLIVRLAEGDSLTLSKLVNFDELTAVDKIVEAFVTPDTRGVYDFSTLIFTLTDPLDSSVSLRFRLRRWSSDVDGLRVSYVDVGPNGQAQVGCENGIHRLDARGTPMEHTFTATAVKGNAWRGDAVEQIPDIYKFSVTYDPISMEVKTQNKHVAHLNNLEYYENVWGGFPSGKAKLTITATEYIAETANFCLTSVFGLDLSQEAFDEDGAPIVNVEKSQEEMPQGQVGYEYAIPAATAMDYYSGNCTVKASVYRDYVSEMPISVGVTNGKFKPTVAGWHTIVYTSTDMLGNVAKETRNVYVAEDLGAIDVAIPEDVATNTTLGSWTPVGAATYSGDCGVADMKITATFGEETYDITEEMGFLPEKPGEWKITYTVTDYIGRTGTAEYTVVAEIGEGYILLDKIILPKVFVSDTKYELPMAHAIDYANGGNYVCDVVVTDKNGEKTYKAGDTFLPSVAENGDTVKLSYQYNGAVLATFEVPTVTVREGTKLDVKNYVYGKDVSTSYKDEAGEWYTGVGITANADSALCGWTFATPQLANDFSIIFGGIAEKSNFEALTVTLTDSKNENEKISVTLTVKSSGATMIVGDAAVDVSGTSLANGKDYTVAYSDGKFSFGGVSMEATTTLDGEAFTGFSSSLVYVTVDMINAKAGAGYELLTVNGANLSRRKLEVFAPSFEILGEFGGNQSLNAVYEIFPAVANDVFSPNTSLTLTVTAPDGTIVTDNNGVKLERVAPDKAYYITLTQYGKYQATYAIAEEDWVAENPLSLVKTFFVIDEVAPQVKFINATQTTAKVGDVIVMPDLVYQDNITSADQLNVVRGVFSPSGRYIRFADGENAIQCLYKGEYRFYAMVMDAFGNMASVMHVVTVTE